MKKDKETKVTEEEIKTETPEQESKEEQLEKALNEKNDQFLRICAEYDNFRRRSQKEKQDIYTSSQADVYKELLPVLDNFDRAANNSDASLDVYISELSVHELNFCVRDGNRWTLMTINTNYEWL